MAAICAFETFGVGELTFGGHVCRAGPTGAVVTKNSPRRAFLGRTRRSEADCRRAHFLREPIADAPGPLSGYKYCTLRRASPRKRSEMLSWLRRRRETAERIDAEADAVIGELGVEAYAEARRREYESSNDALALRWNRIALAVGRKSGKLVGLDISTRMAMNA